MISAILIISQKGEVIISRFYRDDIPKAAANDFRLKVIAAKNAGALPPIQQIGDCTFLYTRHSNLYFVAVTRSNVSPSMCFHFIYGLINIFKAYFNEPKKQFDEAALRNNFTLVYELLDEVMDYGYPQMLSIDLLQAYINTGEMLAKQAKENKDLIPDLTGKVDWRMEGVKHRKNEVFIDVIESVDLLMSANGTVLSNEVSGRVAMKTFLSGMPECKFGLNDKLTMEHEAVAAGQKSRSKRPAVELDDCTFHRCVRLGKFDQDRSITFIPPDGLFDLMKYRIAQNVRLPFRLLPVVEEQSATRVAYNVKVIANFNAKLHATKVVFKIPCPPTTARAKLVVGAGRAAYEPEEGAIVWKIRKFPGQAEFILKGFAELMATSSKKAWSRPPITCDFQVPMFTSSGLNVRFLKIFEKSSYKTTKWVRYITKAGKYAHRI